MISTLHLQGSGLSALPSQEIARRITKPIEGEAPEGDLLGLAKLLGVNEVRVADLGSIDGYVNETFGGLTITLNKVTSPKRQRFSLAHELSHILIGDTTGHREISGIGSKRERLCDAIAAELLMPTKSFLMRLGSGQVNIIDIERLSATFQTSIEATACRVMELTQSSLLLAIWEIRQHNGIGSPYLRYARRSNWDSFPYVPRHFVPKVDSSPTLAVSQRSVVKRFEALMPRQKAAPVQSQRFGSYVLSVIHADPLES